MVIVGLSILLFFLLIMDYFETMERIAEREALGKLLGKILNRLNMNFFIERGIKFKCSVHGTWIEMHLLNDFWPGADSVESLGEFKGMGENSSLAPSTYYNYSLQKRVTKFDDGQSQA